MSIPMQFFRWVGSFFSADHPNSSKRLVAIFVLLFVYIPARWYFFLHCTTWYLHVIAFCIDAVFILILFGITTFGEVGRVAVALRSGTQVIEEKETKMEVATKTTTTETGS